MFFQHDAEKDAWFASDSVQNFPTLETYLALFDGHNIRTPEVKYDYWSEEEDLIEQDKILHQCGHKLVGMVG
jgi:hypothetical protein